MTKNITKLPKKGENIKDTNENITQNINRL